MWFRVHVGVNLLSGLMTLSGPDTQRPLRRKRIQGDVRCGTGGVRVGFGGAVCVSKYVCETGGWGGGG